MDTIDADKEVIARYVKDYLKYNDPSELANYLLNEVKIENDKNRALDLLEHAIRAIRNQAQGVE